MDKETKQMFELMLKKFDELGNEIKSVRSEFTKEINDVNTNLKEFQLETQNEIRSLKYQVESNHLGTRTELSKIHKKLDTFVNQVTKSAEDITALSIFTFEIKPFPSIVIDTALPPAPPVASICEILF